MSSPSVIDLSRTDLSRTDPARRRMLTAARFALHLITALLSAVTAFRAIATGVPMLPADRAGVPE